MLRQRVSQLFQDLFRHIICKERSSFCELRVVWLNVQTNHIWILFVCLGQVTTQIDIVIDLFSTTCTTILVLLPLSPFFCLGCCFTQFIAFCEFFFNLLSSSSWALHPRVSNNISHAKPKFRMGLKEAYYEVFEFS